MQIFRKKITTRELCDLPTRDIARCCGVSERTARGWKRDGPPPAAARLLALAVGDMETVAGRSWRGWRFGGAFLYAPDGTAWDTGRLSAWWIERQELPALRRELARYRAAGPVLDVAEVERLQRAVETAQRAAHMLAQCYPRAAERAANGESPPAAPLIRLR